MSINNFPVSVRSRAFTLVEILVVITLMGILAAIVLANLSDARERSRVAKAQTELKSIESAMKLYREETGSMPPGIDNCSLCGWGGWSNPISLSVQDDWLAVVSSVTSVTSARIPERDPWGRYYAYDNNYLVWGDGYPSVVCSLGVDGLLQTWTVFPVPVEIRTQAQGDDVCIFLNETDDE